MGTNSLSVPLILQPEDMPYCGPTCIKMVMAFHGRKTSLGKIVSSLNMTAQGINLVEMGSFLIENGFEVTIEMWLPTFPNRFIGLTDKVEQELLRWCHRGERKGYARDRAAKSIPRFIAQGGVIRPKPVSPQRLREAIEHGCPPILNLNVAFMYKFERRKVAPHFVVLRQVTKNTLTVNDPHRYEGGIKTYPTELVLHACYVWSSGAIFIKPKT